MKKNLSVFTITCMILALLSFSVSAAGISEVAVSGGFLTPDFSQNIYSYDIILPSKDDAMPVISFSGSGTIEKQAEYPGDTTVIKSPDGQEYTFTVREPYEVSAVKEYSLIADGATRVYTTKNYTNKAWDATKNYIYMTRTNVADVANQKPEYALIRFDMSDKDPAAEGKYELVLTLSNKLSNDVDAKIMVANSVQDWVNGDVEKGTFDYIFPDGADFDETYVKTFTTKDVANFTSIPVDISDIVKRQLSLGNKVFTLALDLDYASFANNSTVTANEKVQINVYGIDALTVERYKPVINYYPVFKGSDASLKSIEVKDGIIDKPFNPEVTVYKIGVAEGKTPEIKYMLSDSHANVVYNKTESEVTITVKSHDESAEKTYTFEFVSLEEAGITESGAIRTESVLYKGDSGYVESLAGGEYLSLEVKLRNNNINDKNIILMSVIKSNGRFIEVADITTKTVSAGNTTVYSNEFMTPDEYEGLSVEGYVFEVDENGKKTSLAPKYSVPGTEEISEIISATEKIQYKLDGEDIVFYGKAEAEEIVPFILMKPEYTLSDLTADDFSGVSAITLAKANEEGIWEYRTEVPTSGMFYTAYISNEEYIKVLHTSLNDKLQVLNDIYSDIFEKGEEASISSLKETLGLASEENISDVILGLDTSSVNSGNETALIKLLAGIAKDEFSEKPDAATEEDIEKFIGLYNNSLVLMKLNSGIKVSVPEILSVFAFGELSELYKAVPPEEIMWAEAFVLNKNISSKAELFNILKDSFILALVNSSGNPDYTMSIIEEFGENFELDMSGYEKVYRYRAKLISDLSEKAPFESREDIRKEFDALVKKYLRNLQSGNSGGSGGGSGGSRPSQSAQTVPSGAGITGAGVIHTDDMKPVKVKVFNDIDSENWAYEPTKYLSEKGIINGNGNGNYSPEAPVKREEFAKILCLAFGLEEKEEETEFEDVNSADWYYTYVKAAYQNGAVNGVGNGIFGTGQPLKRQDIAVILARVLELYEEAGEKFTDDSEISDYAKASVYTLKAMGILSGTGNGAFEPHRPVSRAECAKIVYELVKEDK